MSVGDMITWSWHLGESTWDTTRFTGIIVDSRLAKTDYEKVRIFEVLANDGTVLCVREDVVGLELLT